MSPLYTIDVVISDPSAGREQRFFIAETRDPAEAIAIVTSPPRTHKLKRGYFVAATYIDDRIIGGSPTPPTRTLAFGKVMAASRAKPRIIVCREDGVFDGIEEIDDRAMLPPTPPTVYLPEIDFDCTQSMKGRYDSWILAWSLEPYDVLVRILVELTNIDRRIVISGACQMFMAEIDHSKVTLGKFRGGTNWSAADTKYIDLIISWLRGDISAVDLIKSDPSPKKELEKIMVLASCSLHEQTPLEPDVTYWEHDDVKIDTDTITMRDAIGLPDYLWAVFSSRTSRS